MKTEFSFKDCNNTNNDTQVYICDSTDLANEIYLVFMPNFVSCPFFFKFLFLLNSLLVYEKKEKKKKRDDWTLM
jgi:hypothetical protein